MKLQIKSDSQGIDIIQLEGDLDFHSSPDVRREMTKLADKQSKKVLVDLEKVNYIDSSGLATFVELFQKMKRFGGQLVLFNLSQGVRSVFEISKLDSIFKLAKSQQDAFSLVS